MKIPRKDIPLTILPSIGLFYTKMELLMKHFILQVGFNFGDATHFYQEPNSLTADIVDIETGMNSGTTGRYMFQTDTQDIIGGITSSGKRTLLFHLSNV